LSLYILSGVVTTFMFIGLMIPQAHAQTMSPLIEDQDGDGNPLNEESRIGWGCYMDETFFKSLSATLGSEHKPTISVDDCNFVMHYLSGQCEELMAKGANVTGVCNENLRIYLSSHDLLTNDYPTDREQFNSILDEFNQKKAAAEQERATEEANTPSWTKELE
jgi:hypothetical protein